MINRRSRGWSRRTRSWIERRNIRRESIIARDKRGRRRYGIYRIRKRRRRQNRRRIRLIRKHMFIENYIPREENRMIGNVRKLVTLFATRVPQKQILEIILE